MIITLDEHEDWLALRITDIIMEKEKAYLFIYFQYSLLELNNLVDEYISQQMQLILVLCPKKAKSVVSTGAAGRDEYINN